MPKLLPDNIKEQILSATRRLVIERGYNKVTIRDIANECGIATGTFYNYFHSKREVLSALLSDDWDKMQRYMRSRIVNTDLTPTCQLEGIFNDLRAMMRSIHQLWALGFPDDFATESMNRMAHIKKQLRDDLAETIGNILHGHVDPSSEAFLAGFIARAFFSYTYEESSDFYDLKYVLERLID